MVSMQIVWIVAIRSIRIHPGLVGDHVVQPLFSVEILVPRLGQLLTEDIHVGSRERVVSEVLVVTVGESAVENLVLDHVDEMAFVTRVDVEFAHFVVTNTSEGTGESERFVSHTETKCLVNSKRSKLTIVSIQSIQFRL